MKQAVTIWVAGALFGFLGVALGAFGAHALRDLMAPDLLTAFETGVRYQMYHALALLPTALAVNRSPRLATAAGWLFIGGILVFSGSLYLLAILDVRWLGAITPLGGAAFLAGWACLGVSGWRWLSVGGGGRGRIDPD